MACHKLSTCCVSQTRYVIEAIRLHSHGRDAVFGSQKPGVCQVYRPDDEPSPLETEIVKILRTNPPWGQSEVRSFRGRSGAQTSLFHDDQSGELSSQQRWDLGALASLHAHDVMARLCASSIITAPLEKGAKSTCHTARMMLRTLNFVSNTSRFVGG